MKDRLIERGYYEALRCTYQNSQAQSKLKLLGFKSMHLSGVADLYIGKLVKLCDLNGYQYHDR